MGKDIYLTGITTTGTPLPDPGTHPAWGPDNTRVAYIANNNAWAGATTDGDLAMLPVTGVDSFGPGAIIHTGSDLMSAAEGGECDSYPTWSPDSAWVAFAHGTGSRSDPRDAGGSVGTTHTSALYLIRPDGTGLTEIHRKHDTGRGNAGLAAVQVDQERPTLPRDQTAPHEPKV